MFKKEKKSFAYAESLLTDGTYIEEKFATEVWHLIDVEVIVVQRSQLHKFVVFPKRWVVERSFSWLDKCRRLWENCEGKVTTSHHMAVLAFVGIFLRRL